MIDLATYHAVLLTLMMLESLALLVVAKLLIEWFVVGIEPSGTTQTGRGDFGTVQAAGIFCGGLPFLVCYYNAPGGVGRCILLRNIQEVAASRASRCRLSVDSALSVQADRQYPF